MSVRRSLAFSFMDRYAGLALSIASSMAIARLLTPAEVGTFSVVMALLMLLMTVRDLGAGQYIVQTPQVGPAQIRAVWTVQLALGSLLALLCLLASWPVASFYREPRMRPMMAVLALNFLLNPVGSITYAWLMREMRFGALAWGRFSAALAGALVSIGLAWSGHGPISLAWGSLASTVANALVLSLFRPGQFPWLPGLTHVREVLSFGSRMTGASVLGTLSSSAPEFLLARLQSLTAAGFYSRASGLVSMFRSLVSDAVNAVTLPYFAQAAREQRDLPQAFTRVQSYLCALGWSFALGVLLLAHPLMRVLYGPQWDDAVPLARWLALALLFQVPISNCHVALTSTGAAQRVLRATAWQSGCLVLAAVTTAHWGVQVLTQALVLAAALGLAGWLLQVRAHLGLSLRALAAALLPSAGVALCSASGPLLVLWALGAQPAQPLLALALGGALAALGFVAGCVLLRHPFVEEIRKMTKKLRP